VRLSPGVGVIADGATSPNGGNSRTCTQLAGAWRDIIDYAQAVASAAGCGPRQRLIYVNSNPPAGGGAIELVVHGGADGYIRLPVAGAKPWRTC